MATSRVLRFSAIEGLMLPLIEIFAATTGKSTIQAS
jgi:hypothetical protein